MKNIMLDLETMGNHSNAAIISIGAVYFDDTGLGPEFYHKISLESSMKAGLKTDPDTILWWMHQQYEARKEFIGNSREKTLSEVLDLFSNFVKPGRLIWGNGSDFDNVVLATAYDVLDKKRPWQYKNNRCYRTMKNEYPKAPKPAENNLVHNAIEDAKWQARHLISIWRHRVTPVSNSQLNVTAETLINFITAKYNIRDFDQFSCPHTRALAEAIGWTPSEVTNV